MQNQTTIAASVSLKGVGLHTGQVTTMTFLPVEANFGIKFKRTDLEGQPLVNADVNKVTTTTRGTTIKQGEAHVSTIEHALSAITAAGLDNLLIEINGPEVPILDGSSILILEAIEKAGIKILDAERQYFEVTELITYTDSSSGTELIAIPYEDFDATVMIDFNSETLGKQHADLNGFNSYKKEIAPCRTFVFLREIEALLDQGLIKGGDLDNAVVISDKKMNANDLEKLAAKLDKKSVDIDGQGVLNTTKLKFANEPARHKLLDLVGDLALLGVPIKGKIIAKKPGHTSNVEFTKILKKKYLQQKRLKGIPSYDHNIEPIYTSTGIYQLLPHRYPFQLVDKIIELSTTEVVAIKNVSLNEPFFQGHFPGNPVMPGVLQMEALAQAGGVLALSLQKDPLGWDTYFLKLDKVKFKKMVTPGDTLVLKLSLLSPIRRGIVQMFGIAYVGNNIVSEAELTAQIVKRP